MRHPRQARHHHGEGYPGPLSSMARLRRECLGNVLGMAVVAGGTGLLPSFRSLSFFLGLAVYLSFPLSFVICAHVSLPSPCSAHIVSLLQLARRIRGPLHGLG